MSRTLRTISLMVPFVAITLTATACVTNTEGGTPEGWSPVKMQEIPSIAAMVPVEVAADGALTVGTNPPFAPFEFKDSEGKLIGAELDIAEALSQIMGLEYRPVEQDFSMILPSIQSGQIEMGASGFSDTPERREAFDFVNFLYAGVQWTRKPGSNVDPAHPCGLTVSVQRTTISETDDLRPKAKECERHGEEPLEILAYDSSDNAALAVVVGRADAFSADSPVAAWSVEKADGQMDLIDGISHAAPYGFAVPKDSGLGKAAAAAMDYLIESGEYERILAQWGIEDGLVEQALINEQPVEGHE